jgi:TetR/AcrR family transcriptional repressor of nem operon
VASAPSVQLANVRVRDAETATQIASNGALLYSADVNKRNWTIIVWQPEISPVVESYLSTRHRDQPGHGCLMAALGPEAPRQTALVRHSFTQVFRSVLSALARLAPGKSAAARRKKAITVFSSVVGAMIIARAVHDPKLPEEILQVVLASLAASNAQN